MCSLVADETYSEILSCGHYNTEILNASSTLQSSSNRIKQYMYTSLLNWSTICLFQEDKSQGWNLLLNVKKSVSKIRCARYCMKRNHNNPMISICRNDLEFKYTRFVQVILIQFIKLSHIYLNYDINLIYWCSYSF